MRFPRLRLLRWPLRLALLGWCLYRLVIVPALERYGPEDPRRATLLSAISKGDPATLPNVVLFVGDDLGYGDLGCYGSKAIPTPHVDRLAAGGARFTQFYASASVCSPSRAGLLTGRYPVRTRLYEVLLPSRSLTGLGQALIGTSMGIPRDEVLLSELLRARGYTTALVGKWHLGDASPALPNDRGFDHFFGALHSNDMRPFRIYRNREVAIDSPVDQRQLTRWYTDEAVKFLEANRDRPFFLDLPYTAPHRPIHVSDHFHGASRGGHYGDAVAELDASVGEVLVALERLGLERRTLVLFTSDNGPWYEGSPGGLRGRKREAFEGGFRVPLVMHWPDRIAGGQVIDVPGMNFDLFATVLEAAGVPIPSDRQIDGRSLLPILRAPTTTSAAVATASSSPPTSPSAPTAHPPSSPRPPLFFYWQDRPFAVRDGRWKYHRRHAIAAVSPYPWPSLEEEGPFLFDLSIDPDESYDLSGTHLEEARRLEALIAAHEQARRENPRGWR